MSIVDRFICRREGHLPSMTITSSSGGKIGSVTSKCRRCGKMVETPYAPPPKYSSTSQGPA